MKHKDLYDQLARLNALMGTDFTMDLGPGGWAVQTGRQERRRPAKEMYWTLDFAIDMLERVDLRSLRDRLEELEDYRTEVRKAMGWDLDDEPHDPWGKDYCDCDDCYAARDERRGMEEENDTWFSGECPSCGRDVTPVATRNECECGFRPHPGIEPEEPYDEASFIRDELFPEPAKPEALVDCPECGGYGGFEEYEEGRIVVMPCYHCGTTGKVLEEEFSGYRCDRCHTPVYSVGSWQDMAEQGECPTEDGGVLCPACYAYEAGQED